MDLNTRMISAPYSIPHKEKAALYEEFLTRLTRFHQQNCPEYRRLLKALGHPEEGVFSPETTPMLPVSIFKDLDLKSVSDEAVFKTLTSSGTTGQRVSKIYLDAETSANQQRVLYRIVSDFVGEKRLPFLVLDSKKVLRDRAMFSARGAGILGFSIFASQTFYALDENMVLDLDGVRRFLDTHGGGPVLLFGFTYMVWRCGLTSRIQSPRPEGHWGRAGL